LRYYDDNPGLGVWMTVERATETPLGLHVLNHIQGEALIQVGFILAKHAWGRGVASEMAAALLRYGFTTLALTRIVAITAPDNVASQRALLTIGLHRRGDRSFPHPAYTAAGPQAFFERNAEDWLQERG
jgi:ribosomal-protein-alanine N-acetyltransferase